MRKSLTLLLAAVLLLAGGLAFGQTITVLLGIDAAGKHMGERAQEFTAKTGIKVNLVEVEWDAMVNKQAVALKAKEPTYDIVDCGSFMLPEYVPGGFYADISDMYTPAERAKFMDGMLEGVTIGGKLYAAPLMASWTIMFYNSEMFKEAGLDPNKPPKTWDELVAYGKKLQRPDHLRHRRLPRARRVRDHRLLPLGQVRRRQDQRVPGQQGVLAAGQPGVREGPGVPAEDDPGRDHGPRLAHLLQQQIADLFGKGQSSMLVNWDMMQLAFKNPEQTPYAGKIFPAPMPGAKAGLSGSIEGHEYLAVPAVLQEQGRGQAVHQVPADPGGAEEAGPGGRADPGAQGAVQGRGR